MAMRVRGMSVVRPLVALVALVGVGAACTAETSTNDERLGQSQAKVIKGTASDASQDSVVLLIHFDPKDNSYGECTGTLLAPRLVLTARHCVADTDESLACDASGKPLAGGKIRKNYAGNTMYVFTGSKRPDFSGGKVDPAGRGAQVLDDGSTNLCNHDIALVVLEDPIPSAPISPIRVDAEPQKGESITAVGWGVTDRVDTPTVRQQRPNVKIIDVGPIDDALPVPSNEFAVGEAICSGDSGGPALSDAGGVVGVVSRGGNGSSGTASDPASTCVNGENIYTKVAAFKDFILRGYELVDAEPWFEGQPDPRKLKPGATCIESDECRSAVCHASGTTKVCAQTCTGASECATDEVCAPEGGIKVCQAAAPQSGGCTTSGGTPASGSVLAILLGLVACARTRRRPS